MIEVIVPLNNVGKHVDKYAGTDDDNDDDDDNSDKVVT